MYSLQSSSFRFSTTIFFFSFLSGFWDIGDFHEQLMEVLTNDEDSDTISWLPHGRSFIIYKKKKFASKVLVKYFKATKFTSFTRKLNRWGFTRVTRGPEMGSYFHKMFLRDNPELCLRMSSLTSGKYHHTHHDPTNPIHSNSPNMHSHLMMSPGDVPGFVPGGGMGIPMVPFPFYGMPAISPGAAPMGMVSPTGGVPPPTMVQTKMPTVPATAAELSHQNQYINQQLQQLQWQQFQLQQFQQQQLQASQQAAASAAAVSNANNGPGTHHQQPTPGVPPPQIVAHYPSQQMQAPTGAPGNAVPPPSTVVGTPGTAQHPPATNQAENGQHSGPAPHAGHQQIQQQLPPHMNLPPNGGPHLPQQHSNYQHQHSRPSASQQPPNHHTYGHNPQYQYGQQQSHPGHSPTRPHQGVNNGANPTPMGNHGGHHQGGHPQPYPYQYPQQQSYHHPHPQHAQHQQYQQQQQQQHQQQQHQQQQHQQQQQQDYNPHFQPHHIAGPGQQQQSDVAPLSSSSAQQQSPTPDATDEIAEPLDQSEQSNEAAVAGATEVVDK
jgi:hypothetical protein